MGWTFLDNSGRIKELLQAAGINPTQQIFTSGSGTYTTPQGCTAILVECIGGGGGGSGTPASGSTAQLALGPGGGGGAYANKLIVNPSLSYAYAVGAGGNGGAAGANNGVTGGNTTFGSTIVVAQGGNGGSDRVAGGTGVTFGVPGAGGTAASSTGDVKLDGNAARVAWRYGASFGEAMGGNAAMSGAWRNDYQAVRSASVSSSGGAATSPGGGGGGAIDTNNTATAGGNGANGLIVVTEFYGVQAKQSSAPQINFTSQDFSAGPPASPNNGDIWFATSVDANGTIWQFRYNAVSASTYKWEFVGGPPVRVVVGAFEFTTTAGSWTDTATVGPSYTTSRAGDYQVSYSADMSDSVAAAKIQVGPALGAGTPPDSTAIYAPAASGYGTNWRTSLFTGLSASQEIRLRYFQPGAGTLGNGNRQMYVTPVRVS